MFFSKTSVITFALLGLGRFASVEGECPNACSGHGQCGSYDMCTCDRNWQGSDCSQRTCPFGLAHVDTPKGDLDASNSITDHNDVVITGSTVYPHGTTEGFPYMVDTAGTVQGETAHNYMECSNKGLCDRRTGECECLPGYDGAACQRASCPTAKPLDGENRRSSTSSTMRRNVATYGGRSSFTGVASSNVQINECSGHGTCETIEEIAFNDNGNRYTLWDKESSMGCNCDPGYAGPDCSERQCKYGIDPLWTDDTTARVTHTVVRFKTPDAGTLTGTYAIKFYDVFGEDYQTEPLILTPDGMNGVDDHCVSVRAALLALPNGVVPSVDCNSAAINTNEGFTYTLTFTGNPGELKELELNKYLDGSVSTVSSTSGSTVEGVVYTKILGEFIDYFPTRCEGITVKILADSANGDDSWTSALVRPGSLGYIAGLSDSPNPVLTAAEKKILKACLGDSDGDMSNNVDVTNWDKGVVVEADGSPPTTYNMIGAYPHAIKVVPVETSTGYNKYKYGEYHLVWYDESAAAVAADKEFRVANLNNGHNLPSEAVESYVYTTTGVVQQMGWGNDNTDAGQLADNSGAGSSSTRIVGWFDAYTNKIYTNYDTSCENQPSSGNPRNHVCVEKGHKLFVLDSCWGAGDLGAATTSPFFGGPALANCADSTLPNYHTGNLYTVTKVYTQPLLSAASTNDPTETIDITNNPGTEKYVDTYVIEVNANFGWEGKKGDPENTNVQAAGGTRDDDWSDNTGIVTLFHFTPPDTTTGTGSSDDAYEYVSQCSNRGVCRTDLGVCQCFKGYTMDDCGTQNALAV